MKWISHQVSLLQRFANRSWYPSLVGFLAALDNIILVVPNDGILISSSMLTPKRWWQLALLTSLGSTLGALALCLLVKTYGLEFILTLFPRAQEAQTWQWTLQFFDRWGIGLVFLVAVAPVPQQPAVVLASLSHLPVSLLLVTIFVGRLIKFTIMAWVASHTPQLLKKMWGLKSEMEEVGIDPENPKSMPPNI
ncbi:MAG: YqaA family protein [Bdellovibrionales bacterium]